MSWIGPRAAFTLTVVAVTAFASANGYSCTYNGVSLAGIPLTNPMLKIDEVVPSDPSQDATYYWQFSLCTQTPSSYCNVPAGYVMEISGNLDRCVGGYNNALSEEWSSKYGGANALFGGQWINPNDHIANVTLLCDPMATTLQPAGAVNAHVLQGGATWVFDIVLKSNAVCDGPVPPPTPSGPIPTPPSPRTGAIEIATFDALFCSDRGTKSQITPGCVAHGLSGSVLSICTGDASTLQQLYFSNSTTCAGTPALTETTTVGQCVNNPILQLGSTQLLNCTAQFLL